MRTLILIKHSLPTIDPAVSAHDWGLSDEGRRRCAALAARLRPYDVGQLVSSPEPKAVETASLVAAALGVPVASPDPGLGEHDRRGEPFSDEAIFRAAVADFFARPDELVFGNETAEQAAARFDAAVARVLAAYSAPCVGIVAHGTVISLYAAQHIGLEPYPLWQRLGLPSFLVMAMPDDGVLVLEGEVFAI